MVLMLPSGSRFQRVPACQAPPPAPAASWRRKFPRSGRVHEGSGAGCESPEQGSQGHGLMGAPRPVL